ncbi:hypothetical protein [Nocardioides rubriscoriae]|uniref:hypothetical protein n=1 Tax=Nocardioides rubriscoriae TaxID=642762 RepID=UPI0011E03668|nr:hypothetical protein [Nocardioides rubriscoriae]
MRRAAFAAAGAAVLLGAVSAPAHADRDDAIGLSTDGVHWAPDLVDPLFDADLRWVPGDERTATFYVRNERPDLGDLSVSVDRVVSDTLRATGWLAVSARAGDQPWVSITDGGSHELVDQDDVASDEPVTVQVRVAMSTDAPNDTMVLGTDLDFSVRLTDATAVLDDSGSIGGGAGGGTGGSAGGGAGGTGTPDDPQSAAGFLPGTGSEVPLWLPPLALLLLGSGSYLVVRSRRHDDEPEVPCADLADQHLPA